MKFPYNFMATKWDQRGQNTVPEHLQNTKKYDGTLNAYLNSLLHFYS